MKPIYFIADLHLSETHPELTALFNVRLISSSYFDCKSSIICFIASSIESP